MIVNESISNRLRQASYFLFLTSSTLPNEIEFDGFVPSPPDNKQETVYQKIEIGKLL